MPWAMGFGAASWSDHSFPPMVQCLGTHGLLDAGEEVLKVWSPYCQHPHHLETL